MKEMAQMTVEEIYLESCELQTLMSRMAEALCNLDPACVEWAEQIGEMRIVQYDIDALDVEIDRRANRFMKHQPDLHTCSNGHEFDLSLGMVAVHARCPICDAAL